MKNYIVIETGNYHRKRNHPITVPPYIPVTERTGMYLEDGSQKWGTDSVSVPRTVADLSSRSQALLLM